jgi:hypothetical protein
MNHDTKIRKRFFDILSNRPKANDFILQLEKETELLLFGGCVRDYLDHNYEELPRDFDIVVKKDNNFSLKEYIKNTNCFFKENKFGGFKIHLDDLTFDIWEIHKTWAFKEQKVEYKSYIDLNKTVFLNIDSIFYNLNSCNLYNEEYLKAFRNNELDIILDDNPFPDLNITRALKYQSKYNLKFSSKLNDFFVKWLDKHENPLEAINHLKSIEIKRYNNSTINWSNIYNETNNNQLKKKTPTFI